jgi:hypothetical protein
LKYTENGIIDYLADKDKDYAESISDEEKREFCKELAKRIEPLWKDIHDYENGNIFKRLRVYIKSLLLSKKATCNVPHDVIESLAATFLPDIRAFFESEEGKKEFEEWKVKRDLKKSIDTDTSKQK